MRGSAARYLPTATRLRSLLTTVAWGIDAASALEDLDDRDVPRSAILLPQHTRVLSDTKTGSRLVEVYLRWTNGTVIAAAPGEAVNTSWKFVEHGKTQRGKVTLVTDAAGTVEVLGQYPEHATAPRTHANGMGFRAAAAALAKDARAAEWSCCAELERYTNASLTAANRKVARELEGHADDNLDPYADRSNHGAVDEFTLEKLCGRLLYGTADSSGDSVILRLVRRCATSAIANQPLGSYIAVNIDSATEEAIRREIGDPHIGRKVRRLARETGAKDLETLIAAYRAAHPTDELGRKRAIAALSAGKTIDAVASPFNDLFGVA